MTPLGQRWGGDGHMTAALKPSRGVILAFPEAVIFA